VKRNLSLASKLGSEDPTYFNKGTSGNYSWGCIKFDHSKG